MVAAEIVDEAERTEDEQSPTAKGLTRALVLWVEIQVYCCLYSFLEASFAWGPINLAMNLRFFFFLRPL